MSFFLARLVFLWCVCASVWAYSHDSSDRPVVMPEEAVDHALPDDISPPYWPQFRGANKVMLLDGLWSTSRIGSIDHPPSDFDSLDPTLDPSKVRTYEPVTIPSCVDNTPPGYLGYRGVSFFRRTFDFNLTYGARIQFQACSFYCRVWINGKEIGDHRTGYVAFSLDIPPQQQKKKTSVHEIFVLVDNRFNATTAPLHTGGDFWHYGGIMRSVEVHAMPPPPQVWPWRLYAFPEDLSSVRLSLHLMIPQKSSSNNHVQNNSNNNISNIAIGFDDGTRTNFSGTAVNGVVDLGVHQVPHPRIWSTTDPQLHTVQVELDGAILSERFGLRIFDIEPDTARIRLNGHPIQLVGWNHHTQWPNTAASPTDAQLDKDIMLLKEGGANFVRGAHYPQDPRWLDRLDETGMVMWCETLGPSVSVANTLDPIFRQFQAQQMNEMLDSALNHPSIAIWAFFNEGPSNVKEACDAYQENAHIIKSRDATRFVSYANNKGPPGKNDHCHHAVDVISANSYPGWYGRTTAPTKYWNQYAWDVATGEAAGKPILISETGAGGIYEWNDNGTASLWTISYQTQVIAEDVDAALGNVNISGIALWHFFDFKVNDIWENGTHCEYLPNVYPPTCGYIDVNTSTPSGRPGGANHKGSLDFWRREKPAYQVVAAKYNATKVLHQSKQTSYGKANVEVEMARRHLRTE